MDFWETGEHFPAYYNTYAPSGAAPKNGEENRLLSYSPSQGHRLPYLLVVWLLHLTVSKHSLVFLKTPVSFEGCVLFYHKAVHGVLRVP